MISHSPRSAEKFRISIFLGFVFILVFGCQAALPKEALVSRVIDGDTIEISTGRLVRYIGIDTPELRRRIGDRWVKDPEPFAEAALLANRRLVEKKRVKLEYDVRTHDKYGRILAYVYVDEGMVNALLLEEGLAHLLTIPPDVKYTERFREAADLARQNSRGLWSIGSAS